MEKLKSHILGAPTTTPTAQPPPTPQGEVSPDVAEAAYALTRDSAMELAGAPQAVLDHVRLSHARLLLTSTIACLACAAPTTLCGSGGAFAKDLVAHLRKRPAGAAAGSSGDSILLRAGELVAARGLAAAGGIAAALK